MFDIFIRSLLGPWGQKILDAYIANSLWINGLILLYFAILVLSRWNYRRTQAAIVAGIQARYAQSSGKKATRDIRARLAQDGVPWEAGLGASFWPLIAGPRHVIPRLKNTPTLQKLFSPDDLIDLYVNEVALATTSENE